MSPLNASTLNALETLRRQAALVVSLCDSLLYARKNVPQTARQLVPALEDLRARTQLAIDVVELEGT
jgi:hypothetical protein